MSEATVERRDINVRAVYAIGGGLIVTAVVVHLVAWWIFDALQVRERESKRSPFPLAAQERDRPPREPRLEEVDRRAGNAEGPLYAAERKRLETYGWVDEKEGVVRVPIERAMKMIVEEKRLKARRSSP